jgi:hypothetical protein
MKFSQFSIGKLMAVVGIVALNLTFAHFWTPTSEPTLFTGRFLMSIALQVGLFRLICNQRTKSLSFWYGFEAFGLAAAITTIYIDILSPDGSEMFRIMDLYLFNTVNLIEKSLRMLISDNYCQAKIIAFVLDDHRESLCEVMYFMPQFFIAMVGGFLTSLTVRCLGRRNCPVVCASTIN